MNEIYERSGKKKKGKLNNVPTPRICKRCGFYGHNVQSCDKSTWQDAMREELRKMQAEIGSFDDPGLPPMIKVYPPEEATSFPLMRNMPFDDEALLLRQESQ